MQESPHIVPEIKKERERPVVPKALSNPNCPIEAQHVETFVSFWKDQGFSNELITKILDNIRFIDQEAFQKALTYLAKKIESFTKGDDYYIYIAQWNKSESLVLDLLFPLLKRKPKALITHESLRRGVSVDGAILEKIPPNSKVVHLNDWSLTGNQDYLRTSEAIHELENPDFASFFVAITDDAKQRLTTKNNAQVFNYFSIPKNKEVYTPPELKKLEAISTTDQFESFTEGVQTFSYFKVPDNFPTFIRGRKAIKRRYPWLVNDWQGGIYPKYKDETYNKIIRRAELRKKPLLGRLLAPF